MTPISKTAYPHYNVKKKISKEKLAESYLLLDEEVREIKHLTNDENSQLLYAVLLKTFRQLNYFPRISCVPNAIIQHIKEQLKIKDATISGGNRSTVTRYKERICDKIGIIRWRNIKDSSQGKIINQAYELALKAATKASKTLNYPADIINVVIEDLIKKKVELPTYKQLDRLAKHARSQVNKNIFKMVNHRLTEREIDALNALLKTTPDYQRSDYNKLKALPKNPTISHFRELIGHHEWLSSFGGVSYLLRHISPIKLRQFSEQARSQDASDLKGFSASARYTLILCLIFSAQTDTKDALAITLCKSMARIHKKAKEKLEIQKEAYREKTLELLSMFSDILMDLKEGEYTPKSLNKLRDRIDIGGGANALQLDCEKAMAFNSNNYLPLLWHFFIKKRPTIFKLLKTLDLESSTQHDSVIRAMEFILDDSHLRSEYLPFSVDLSFTTEHWRKLIVKREGDVKLINRRHLEACVSSHIANDLRSGDIFIHGAGSYGDYRKELLPWDSCEEILDEYCAKLGLANNGADCVKQLRECLHHKARDVDRLYPTIAEFVIDESGNPTLKRRGPKRRPSSAVWLEKSIKERMPERNLIDVLCSSHFYCGWADEFGPISGNDHKIDNHIERYILTNFAYATGLGPAQTAQHVRDSISAHMISWINRRHVTPNMLDKARKHLVNLINQFKLPKSWGDGTAVAVDGTLHELREQNIISEFHVRYGKKGGIAYHHVADNYILLFSTFMPCGVWEAVEIIEGLLKNDSDVQPDIIHGDTQSQSTIVFAVAYLLGFKLMPRIRNWKDVKFFRPSKSTRYKNIDSLFSDPIKWDIIERHWKDMMQVVLSIHEGKISSSVLLRKLGNYSRKNRLYQAFQELGRVIRTLFMLDYISDVELRESITSHTNKVEAYNGLSGWCSFGSDILVASNDAVEMEKAVKYNDILTNSIMLQNVVDMTDIIVQLIDEGMTIRKEDTAYLSPYWTEHLKRFGDIVLDLEVVPKSVDKTRSLVIW